VSSLGLGKNCVVYYRGRCCRDDQKDSFEIGAFEVTRLPINTVRLEPISYLWRRTWRNNADVRTGFEKTADLAFANWACADYKASSAFELQENREEWGVLTHELAFQPVGNGSGCRVTLDRFDNLASQKAA